MDWQTPDDTIKKRILQVELQDFKKRYKNGIFLAVGLMMLFLFIVAAQHDAAIGNARRDRSYSYSAENEKTFLEKKARIERNATAVIVLGSVACLSIMILKRAFFKWTYQNMEKSMRIARGRCVGKSPLYRRWNGGLLWIKLPDGTLIEECEVSLTAFESAKIDEGLLLVTMDLDKTWGVHYQHGIVNTYSEDILK